MKHELKLVIHLFWLVKSNVKEDERSKKSTGKVQMNYMFVQIPQHIYLSHTLLFLLFLLFLVPVRTIAVLLQHFGSTEGFSWSF